jgi:hypothetical protein
MDGWEERWEIDAPALLVKRCHHIVVVLTDFVEISLTRLAFGFGGECDSVVVNLAGLRRVARPVGEVAAEAGLGVVGRKERHRG